MHSFQGGKTGAAITVKVTPRARKNEITGILEDGTIKVKLTAPPVEGQANAALIRYLAELLGTPVSEIEIIGGLTGRQKLVTITGMSAEEVQALILKAVA